MPTSFRNGGSPTVGVMAGWQYYWTPTPLNYLNPVYRGIRQAAADLGCNLLLGCGMGPSAASSDLRPAWPTRSPESDFVPVGPWNTDGLIAINPLQSAARSRYCQELMAAGHPVMFVASGEPGPTIVAENAAGIREAMHHLVGHGHQRIGFIAGSPEDMAGDTGARLEAYRGVLQELALASDEHIIAFGRHIFAGGYAAMQQIIHTGAPFTAILASNDGSALGAMRALREAGLRVPKDVAIIGFDDRPENAIQEVPLSSVAVPLFEMGYRAVEQLLRQIRGEPAPLEPVRIATRLVPRASCGCGGRQGSRHGDAGSRAPAGTGAVGVDMGEIQAVRRRLTEAFVASVDGDDPALLGEVVEALLRQATQGWDEAAIWQASFAVISEELPAQVASWPEGARRERARVLLMETQAVIAGSTWQRHRETVVGQRWTAHRVGLLTAHLQTALDETQAYDILARHLPDMGIEFAAVALFERASDDPEASCSLRILAPPGRAPIHFLCRQFPPPGLLPADRPFSLALLPLVNPGRQLGFVVFDSQQLDLYGPIVQQLAAALNTAQLYREATEGRRLAEKADRIKTRFLSTVSHELRTPLNLIVGLGEILLRDSDRGETPLPPAAHKDIERLNANARHLSRLISDVLDLASSDADRLRLSSQYVDLVGVLREVAETGRQISEDKGLGWVLELPVAEAWVWGDRTRLSQVAMNLVSNAIKFTARGEVCLALELIGSSAVVRVSDTGLGIPVEEQASIFDEFRRSERSIKRGYDGLGLGLAICKRLIELQGGTIGLHSSGEEGAGSVFFFTLPLIESPARRISAAEPARPEAGVLILTSAASTSERLRDYLNARGFEVHTGQIDEAASWQSHLLTSAPSAIVLDVSLAADHGWQILKLLKANPVTQNIPVLFYALSPESAAPQEGSAPSQAASVLELNYLTKPVRLADLTPALDQHWPATTPGRSTRKFLVVDDDPDTLEMHARILWHHTAQGRSTTQQVFKARNGLEALRVLQEERIDLVLLDLIMPEMDGFAVLEAMHQSPSLRDIPVIVVTGQTLSEAEMARLNLGVTKVLSKGVFSLEETLAHLDAALARRRELSGEAQRLVRRAMAYLQEHHAEAVSREELAAHVGLSDDYLTACFHKELGLTPVAYLNRYRVERAKQLLKRTHKSITEIALEVGFSGSSYFSRIFHRETGMSPAEYRRA